ncbi:Uncharacterised protein [Porphyromonas cangingivalis]|nr:Uncharacterised protein [Porphyromonas cangingivalis]
MKTNIVDIFCMVDDFSKLFDQTIKEKSIEKDGADGTISSLFCIFAVLKTYIIPILPYAHRYPKCNP